MDDAEGFAEAFVLVVDDLEILAHVEEVAGDEGFELEGDQGARLGVLGGVEGDGVGRGAGAEFTEQVVADGEAAAEVGEGGVLLAQGFAVAVDVAHGHAVDDAKADDFAVVVGVACGVDGDEAVGHDAASAIDGAVVDEGVRPE